MDFEKESLEHSEDANYRAMVLLQTGMDKPHVYSRNDRIFGPDIAFQSQVLVRDLLKLGLFSMNIHSMAGLEDVDGNIPVSFARVPASLLSIGLDYAIDVAPTDANDEIEVPVVSLDQLEYQIQRLEQHFGQIVVDISLVARVARLARDILAQSQEPGIQLDTRQTEKV